MLLAVSDSLIDDCPSLVNLACRRQTFRQVRRKYRVRGDGLETGTQQPDSGVHISPSEQKLALQPNAACVIWGQGIPLRVRDQPLDNGLCCRRVAAPHEYGRRVEQTMAQADWMRIQLAGLIEYLTRDFYGPLGMALEPQHSSQRDRYSAAGAPVDSTEPVTMDRPAV